MNESSEKKIEDKGWADLTWDSNEFGFKVGRVVNGMHSDSEIEDILLKARQAGVKLMYWFASENVSVSDSVLQKFRGSLVDQKVTFMSEVSHLNSANTLTDLEFAMESYPKTPPNSDLINLSLSAGEYSRYAQDALFPKQLYRNLYQSWITKSTLGEIADAVIVIRVQNDRIVGFSTISLNECHGKIGLIAVDKSCRRQGLAKVLMNETHAWMVENEVRRASVVTQLENIPACNLYKSCGYSVQQIEKVFHFWLTN